LLEVFRASQVTITPVHDHYDVERLEHVTDTPQRPFEILRRDFLAWFLVPKVQHDAVREKPLDR